MTQHLVWHPTLSSCSLQSGIRHKVHLFYIERIVDMSKSSVPEDALFRLLAASLLPEACRFALEDILRLYCPVCNTG